MKTSWHLVLALTSVLLSSLDLHAADWPMWRGNAQHNGTVEEPLADELHLQWSRELPANDIAWPNEPRLQYDASCEPIVLGNRIFVGSSTDGSLTAFDTSTGKLLWRFFSEGPVRLAAAAWEDRVFFGSDDGNLYCLNAETGELHWKVRGAPLDRPDYKHMGNARLISYWPVRGGPVVANETVYFGAGIWPTMGVFIHAVDAKTGEIKWTNSNTNYLKNVRIDHNYLDDVGLSPQGHFLIVDDKLIVPNGRSMPARFDSKTGELQYYVQGYRNGDSRVAAGGQFLFVGEQGVVNVTDGREVGNRWTTAGEEAPQGWSTKKRDLFEGPFDPYKFLPGCNFRSVFAGDLALGVEKGVLYSYKLNEPKTTLYEKKMGANVIRPARWDLPPLWEPLRLAKQPSERTRSIIKAGNRVYTHVGKTLMAVETQIDAPKTAPRVAWSKELESAPASMLVGDDRLFVVLEDGRLLCFGDKPREAAIHSIKEETLSDAARDEALKMLNAADCKEGYALVLGIDSGQLIEALLNNSDLHVIAADPDVEKVNAARLRWTKSGVYGARVEAFVCDAESMVFPPYLANIIVSEIPGKANPLSQIAPSKLFSLLRPYGGKAMIPAMLTETHEKWNEAKIRGAAVASKHGMVLLQRNGAAEGSADWTHETGDAARTYFSTDEQVQSPLALLWYGDGPDHGFAKHKDYGRGVKPQVAHGRLFAFNDRGKYLSAVDIYTGRLLWKHETETSVVRFVSMPDAVYVASGLECVALNPATGAELAKLTCNIETEPRKQPGAVAVRATNDLLLLGIGFDLPAGHSHSSIESGLWDAKVLVAFDRHTGKQIWARRAEKRFNLHSIAIGKDKVFCVDSMAPLEADKLVRRGLAPEKFASTLLALDVKTGTLNWKKEFTYGHRNMTGSGPLAIRPYDDWAAFNAEHNLVLCGKLTEVHALNADNGEAAWSSPSAGMQPLIVSPESYINQRGHRFSITTGEQMSESTLFQRSGGCNYTVGNKNLLFLRNKCAAYIDIREQKEYSLRNLRSGCSNSLVAAGGLLNAPCFSTGCVCNYPLQTSFSMYHLPESAIWAGDAPLELPRSE